MAIIFHLITKLEMKNLLLKKTFLTVFIPTLSFLLVLTGSLSFYVYQQEKARILDSTKTTYSEHLFQQSELIRAMFASTIKDLNYLAINTSFLDYLNISNEQTQKDLLNTMHPLAQQNWNYRQVRFLDWKGMEKIRFNWHLDSLHLAGADQLQDKSDRYYFLRSRQLKKGQVYVSPVDLNVEHGKIEVPHQAVIRFCKPIYQSDNHPVGILVINQYLNSLFQWLLNRNTKLEGNILLLNQEGYWLASNDEHIPFGFMFKEHQNEKFSTFYPLAWKQLQNNAQGEVLSNDRLIVFRKFSLGFDLKNNKLFQEDELAGSPESQWLLVANIPTTKIHALQEMNRLFRLSLLLSILILFCIAYIISWLIYREKEIIKELNVLNKTLEQRVTERTTELQKSNTELKAVNEELEAFTYSVSHDLRAPLRHISGFADLLVKKNLADLTGQGPVYLNYIKQSTQEMNQLILDLLNFSRIIRSDLNCTKIDMSKLVKEVQAVTEESFPNQKIDWTISALPEVYGDRNLLRQVWINLLSNAVKYSSNQKISKIEISHQQQKKQFIFQVKDNGVGFDETYSHKLFKTFQRLHSSEDYEGTGIGLAIVRKIIIRHHGEIWAKSQAGQGATFYFSIPITTNKKNS